MTEQPLDNPATPDADVDPVEPYDPDRDTGVEDPDEAEGEDAEEVDPDSVDLPEGGDEPEDPDDDDDDDDPGVAVDDEPFGAGVPPADQ